MNKHQKLEWIDIGKKLLKEYKFNKECEPDANKKEKKQKAKIIYINKYISKKCNRARSYAANC